MTGFTHPVAAIAVEIEQHRAMRLAMIEAAVKLECAGEHLSGFGMPLTGESCKNTATNLRKLIGMPRSST